MLKTFTTAVITAVLALGALGQRAQAQKALVYCPVGIDATGCNRIVTALQPKFADGVDRGYDGSAGTLDLKTVDLHHYSVFVVPSLADDSARKPYAVLRAAAERLHFAINGRVTVYSGAPDQGTSNRADKDALILNLAKWAAAGHTRKVGLVGLVALLDMSQDENARYSWVRSLSLVEVSADAELQSSSDATPVGARSANLLKVGAKSLAFSNMATSGLHIGGRSAARTEVGAMGGKASHQNVLITYANADGPDDAPAAATGGASFSRSAGSASLDASASSSTAVGAPTLTTNRPDYQPGDTVTFTGAGFAAGDTVTITVHVDSTQTYPDRQYQSVADANGSLVNTQMIVATTDFGMFFTATAVGNPSGKVAQITFTDGNAASVSGTVTDAATSLPLSGVTVSCTSGCNASISTTSSSATPNYTFDATTIKLSFGGNGPATLVLSFSKVGYTTGSLTISSINNSDTRSNQNIALTLAGPTKLAFTSTALSGAVGSCLGPVAVQTQNSGGAATNVASSTTVNLTTDNGATGTGAFYGLSSCSAASATTSVNIASGSSSGSFYYKATARGSGTHQLTAASSGLTSATQDETITKADQTITFAALADKTYGDVDFAVSATSSSGLPVSLDVGLEDNCTISSGTVHLTGAGSCTVTASQAGNGDFNAATSVANTFKIAKATPSFSFGALGDKTFGDVPFSVASAVTTNGDGALSFALGTGSVGCTVTTAGQVTITGAAVGTNKCVITATLAPGANYLGAGPSTQTFNIAKAHATINLGGLTPTYTGSPLAATATTTPTGLSITITYNGNAQAPTDVGTYAVVATISDNNYDGATSGSLMIGKAGSTVTVSCPTTATTFTGAAITPCSASAAGVGLTSAVSLTPTYSNNTNVGSASASATWPGDANHTGNSGAANFDISKASSTVTVSCPTTGTTYTGVAITPCSASATGAGITTSIPVTPTYSNNVNAGTATANATYDGDANHTGNSGTANFTIDKAASTVTVSCPTTATTFTGSAITPCSASATGAGITAPISVTPVNYSNNINVGSATANASYAGDANHTGNSGTANFDISKASSSVTVSCSAGPFVYNGSPFTPCTASATGAGITTPIFVAPSYSNNTNAGMATANATYAGDANHTGNSGTANFTIDKATSSVTVSCPTTATTYTGSPITPCSASATGVALTPAVGLAPTYSNNINVGTATASASWLGDANHTGNSGTANFDISKASSTVTVSCSAGPFVYNGSPFTPCTASATGAGISTPVAVTQVNYSNNINAGPATASATYSGDANHSGSFGSTNFTIDKATSSVTVSCSAGPFVYNGSPFTPCTASATGAAIPTPIPVMPTYSNNLNAGTATANASWPGDVNHTGSMNSATFTINQAPATVVLSNLVQAYRSGSVLTPSYTTTPSGVQVTLSFLQNGSTATPSAVGVYNVNAKITDPNYIGPDDNELFVIYDASGGFVTGGGWINSPLGACQQTTICNDAVGKANFGFVSKYEKGATIPTGSTEFQFQAGNLNFKSTSYQWLTVSGARAQYKGTGTINGTGSYDFILTAVDGSLLGGSSPDQFRIKIMSNGVTVYDNQLGNLSDTSPLSGASTQLGGGSISIKSK